MSHVKHRMRHVFWRAWHFDLTSGGKALVAGILISGVTGSLTLVLYVYNLFLALLALYTAAGIVSLIFKPKLTVSGSLPAKAVAGQELACPITVTNVSRRPAYDLSLGLLQLPSALSQQDTSVTLEHLPAGQQATMDLHVRPQRRGQYDPGPLTAYSTFPFNLIRRMGINVPQSTMTVLPRFWPLERVELEVSQRHQPGGIAYGSHVGESPEYIGSRDFRPGDSPRKLDHRSWARLAAPAVKEYLEEYYCRIGLVLDTHLPGPRKVPPEGFPSLEAAVSMTAALAEALSRGEYIIDLFAAGPELYTFSTGRHTANFENILEILACVGPCWASPFHKLSSAMAKVLPNTSTVVFVFLDWEAQRRELVRSVVEAGCRVKVLVIPSGPLGRSVEADQEWTGPVLFIPEKDILSGKVLSL